MKFILLPGEETEEPEVTSTAPRVVTKEMTPEPTDEPSEDPTTSCTDTEFTCVERCIPAAWRCDGEADCSNGEDEEDCGKSKGHLVQL